MLALVDLRMPFKGAFLSLNRVELDSDSEMVPVRGPELWLDCSG